MISNRMPTAVALLFLLPTGALAGDETLNVRPAQVGAHFLGGSGRPQYDVVADLRPGQVKAITVRCNGTLVASDKTPFKVFGQVVGLDLDFWESPRACSRSLSVRVYAVDGDVGRTTVARSWRVDFKDGKRFAVSASEMTPRNH
jgi:hypothetical protein